MQISPHLQHCEELEHIVQTSPWLMHALRAVRSLRLSSWCIGAGAVRNLVWDYVHEYKEPSPLSDIDVAYFDRNEPVGKEREWQTRLESFVPALPWEATNQAFVHLWFEHHFGHAVAQLNSLEDAVASWPEYATSVGVYLGEAGNIKIIAPYGLEDLFAVRVRRNSALVSVQTYQQRTAQMQYAKRWPKVSIEPAASEA